jgi:hypothetical protein
MAQTAASPTGKDSHVHGDEARLSLTTERETGITSGGEDELAE